MLVLAGLHLLLLELGRLVLGDELLQVVVYLEKSLEDVVVPVLAENWVILVDHGRGDLLGNDADLPLGRVSDIEHVQHEGLVEEAADQWAEGVCESVRDNYYQLFGLGLVELLGE